MMKNIVNFDVAYQLDFIRLDHGRGKGLSLSECPREQLEKEASGRRSQIAARGDLVSST